MSKDPAFLFYSSDFMTGCSDLTMEERGQYITLLCLQHQKGHLSEKTTRLTVGSVSVDVLKKFTKDADGNFFNERLEKEILLRQKFIDTRVENGLKGGRPKKANANLVDKSSLTYKKANEKLIEDENKNRNKSKVDKERGVGENQKFSVIPNQELLDQMMNQYDRIEVVQKKHGCPESDVKEMIIEFIQHAQDIGETYQTYAKAWDHFNNWFKKAYFDNQKIKKSINGTAKQTRTDRVKEGLANLGAIYDEGVRLTAEYNRQRNNQQGAELSFDS